MAERFDPTKNALIQQAAEIKNAASLLAREEAEAAEQIPVLKKRFDDFVLKLFPEPKRPARKSTAKSVQRKPGEAIILSKGESQAIVRRASENLNAPHGMKVECEVPLEGSDPLKVTITRGTSYYEMFERDQDIIVNVEALPDILVFGDSSGATIESKAHNRAEFTMHTPMGANLDRGPVSKRKVLVSDIEDYSNLVDVLDNSKVKKTASRFHQRPPY